MIFQNYLLMIQDSQSVQYQANEQINAMLGILMQNQSPRRISAEDDQYISNFLFDPIDLSQDYKRTQSVHNELNAQYIQPKNQEIICNNVQKHIYVGIKQQLKLNTNVGDEDVCQSMEILWNAFKNSTKKSKQALLVIFGTFDQNSEEDIKLFSSLNLNTSMFLDAEVIRNAQHLIRIQAIQQLTEDKIKKHVERRRIKKKEEFYHSLIKFVNNLKNGSIRKRKLGKINKKKRSAV